MDYETLKPILLTLKETVLSLIDQEDLQNQVREQFNQALATISQEYFEEDDRPSAFLTGDELKHGVTRECKKCYEN